MCSSMYCMNIEYESSILPKCFVPFPQAKLNYVLRIRLSCTKICILNTAPFRQYPVFFILFFRNFLHKGPTISAKCLQIPTSETAGFPVFIPDFTRCFPCIFINPANYTVSMGICTFLLIFPPPPHPCMHMADPDRTAPFPLLLCHVYTTSMESCQRPPAANH
jgi:hypothetical protein